MSLEKVRQYLQTYGAETRIREFSVSSATVALAAEALFCEPCRIAKTLAFDANGQTVVIVTAGDCKIDNAKYKTFFHVKAKMLSAEETLSRTGHAVGGVCPFALPENVAIYLDKSLQRFTTVFPACGSSNSAIEVTPDELSEITRPQGWIDVCKLIAPE